MRRRPLLAGLVAAAAWPDRARAAAAELVQCIAPAKPGGGFDLTCQLVRDALARHQPGSRPLTVSYQPGGIGALTYHARATTLAADTGAVVAFSGGTLLNLAQGRFGAYTGREVRWLLSLGVDHGLVAVHREAPWTTLKQLMEALPLQAQHIAFGAGGTIGSQDWMKAALLARAAGLSPKAMRLVAFEGGGEALEALAGRHVQVVAGDVAEVAGLLEAGRPLRVLAVLAAQRLPGRWARVPTAREQGYDIRWPILRGLYVGAGVPDELVRRWQDLLLPALSTPASVAAREQLGLQASLVSGPALEQLVARQMDEYRRMARDIGLPPLPAGR